MPYLCDLCALLWLKGLGLFRLESSFLIDLEREIDAGVAGPAMAWLRRNRGLAQRPLIVSCISIAEFLEGCRDARDGMEFILHYIPQNIGFQHAAKCAELQRRAGKNGARFGENDAWQLTFAERAHAAVVGRDRKAFRHLGSRYEDV
jgi:predicted nucleic acid-binding protein